MRKTVRSLLLAAVLVACAGQQTNVLKAADLPTREIADSVSRDGIKIVVKAQFPVDNSVLQQAVGRYMQEDEYMEDSMLLPSHEAQDGQRLVNHLVTKHWQALRELMYSPEGDAGEEGISPDDPALQVERTTYTTEFKLALATTDYATWQSDYSCYMEGTPHPSAGTSGRTFRLSDGAPLSCDDILKDTDSDGFGLLLKEAVRRCLMDITEEENLTDADMAEFLAPRDINHLPLPELPPFLLADGVGLAYMEYELMAHVSFVAVIPYSQLKNYIKLW